MAELPSAAQEDDAASIGSSHSGLEEPELLDDEGPPEGALALVP